MKTIKFLLAIISLTYFCACGEFEPSAVSFSISEASGLESEDTYNIEVVLNESSASDTEITFEVRGTADDFWDFSVNEFLLIPAGSTSETLELTIFDNGEFSLDEKTVIVEIVSFFGSEDVEFGELTTFTYTILENDMEVELSWTPSVGNATDYDLDLYLFQAGDLENTYKSSTAVGTLNELVTITQDDANTSYYAASRLFSSSGVTEGITVDYTITLKFPDGTSVSNSDQFDVDNKENRTLFEIVKSGDGIFSHSTDPFGSNGRGVFIFDESLFAK